ncbi:MAG: ATP-binding cassette domain-containing protein [Actinomycetota bacterium]
MAVIDVSDLKHALPGGRILFEDVSFRVGSGQHVALVGANGTGKTTILRLIAREERVQQGHIHVDGALAFMPQFIGVFGDETTINQFLIRLSPKPIQDAAQELERAEIGLAADSTGAQMRYATALATWTEVGGYDAEVLWDTCCMLAVGRSFEAIAGRLLVTLSGGEQKRLALESLFRSDAVVLLLDEPDNFLDIAGKRWLEHTINTSSKTIFYVSHDRALLATTSTRVVTLEAKGAWTHGASFAGYHDARERRIERVEEEHRRYREEHQRLVASMKELKRRAAISDALASRAKASVTKLERFEETSRPPERPADQDIHVRLRGGRTGKIAFRATQLSIQDLTEPFDAEILFGERIGVVGSNGTGKSHFLRLLNGEAIEHGGAWMLGARVRAGLFSQMHDRPDLGDKALVDIMTSRGLELGAAMAGLRRYELRSVASQPFSLLSGGQQARFQLLILELAGPTMLLLDEPTDNLDVASAEALEQGLGNYEGTVIAVTHDRWFMRLLDRFLVFNDDGTVVESPDHPYG